MSNIGYTGYTGSAGYNSKKWKLGGFYVPDLINPKKWWWFISAWLIQKFVTLEYCEMVVYGSIQCSDCVSAGKCKDCGCDMPGKLLGKGTYCSLGKWDNSRTPERWQEYKKRNKIRFDIKIGD